jgi:hypothetical protein
VHRAAPRLAQSLTLILFMRDKIERDSQRVCVCVRVCVCEREREREFQCRLVFKKTHNMPMLLPVARKQNTVGMIEAPHPRHFLQGIAWGLGRELHLLAVQFNIKPVLRGGTASCLL